MTQGLHGALRVAWVLVSLAIAVAGGSRSAFPSELPPLDLSRFKLVFADEFDMFDISAHGPNSTWIAHTPWNGDFGDARFSDPGPTGPFHVENGMLTITASKDSQGHWRSGLISSQDAAGHGFGLRYGYFEMRAKLPSGAGVWPAFWLGTMLPKGSKERALEIDAMEHYGHAPQNFIATIHLWPEPAFDPDKASRQGVIAVEPGSLSSGFHTYGVEVSPDWITVYFDGQARWRCKTPPEHTHPLMILADLGLGGGWPIGGVADPSVMTIDYIRAYEPRT